MIENGFSLGPNAASIATHLIALLRGVRRLGVQAGEPYMPEFSSIPKGIDRNAHQPADFILERVVHHVLAGHRDACRTLVLESLDAGLLPEVFLNEILWPTIECVEQLRTDRILDTRPFNAAVRILRSLTDILGTALPQLPPRGRSVQIICAPGQRDETAAMICAELAESHGWQVYFAGAHISREELTFSLGQLAPDALLIHAGASCDMESLHALLSNLRTMRIWPAVQLVVMGAIAQHHVPALHADLIGRHPVETFELMALCPEYRFEFLHGTPSKPTRPLSMIEPAPTCGTSATAIRRLVTAYFARRPHRLN